MIFIYALSLTALLCCSTFVLLFISVESRRPKLAVNLSGLLTISLFLWCTAQLVPILPEIRVGPTALPPGSLRAAQQQSYLQKHLVVGAAQETSDVPTLNSSHYSPSQDHTTVSTVLFIHLPKVLFTIIHTHVTALDGRNDSCLSPSKLLRKKVHPLLAKTFQRTKCKYLAAQQPMVVVMRLPVSRVQWQNMHFWTLTIWLSQGYIHILKREDISGFSFHVYNLI